MLIMLSVWVLWHLIILTIQGYGVIAEPNRAIAIGEASFTLVVFIIAIITWLLLIRSKKHGQ